MKEEERSFCLEILRDHNLPTEMLPADLTDEEAGRIVKACGDPVEIHRLLAEFQDARRQKAVQGPEASGENDGKKQDEDDWMERAFARHILFEIGTGSFGEIGDTTPRRSFNGFYAYDDDELIFALKEAEKLFDEGNFTHLLAYRDIILELSRRKKAYEACRGRYDDSLMNKGAEIRPHPKALEEAKKRGVSFAPREGGKIYSQFEINDAINSAIDELCRAGSPMDPHKAAIARSDAYRKKRMAWSDVSSVVKKARREGVPPKSVEQAVEKWSATAMVFAEKAEAEEEI